MARPTLQVPLRDILAALRETYSRSIGVEFMHLQDPAERRWLIERMEPVRNAPALQAADRRRILKKLSHAAAFEALPREAVRLGEAVQP